MSKRFAHLTDGEFVGLLGESPLAFSARLRAQAMAREIHDRVAAVSADLRHWIAAGEVSDPAPVARIARDFDHLAKELESEVGRTDPRHWSDSSHESADDGRNVLPFPLRDYEIEAWHAPAQKFGGAVGR